MSFREAGAFKESDGGGGGPRGRNKRPPSHFAWGFLFVDPPWPGRLGGPLTKLQLQVPICTVQPGEGQAGWGGDGEEGWEQIRTIRLGEITGWGEHATEMKKEKAWKSKGEGKTQKTQLGFVRASKNSQGENKTEAGAASRDRVSLPPAGSVSVVSAETARCPRRRAGLRGAQGCGQQRTSARSTHLDYVGCVGAHTNRKPSQITSKLQK